MILCVFPPQLFSSPFDRSVPISIDSNGYMMATLASRISYMIKCVSFAKCFDFICFFLLLRLLLFLFTSNGGCRGWMDGWMMIWSRKKRANFLFFFLVSRCPFFQSLFSITKKKTILLFRFSSDFMLLWISIIPLCITTQTFIDRIQHGPRHPI